MSSENKCSTSELYLRRLSGQEKEVPIFDHNYVKAWNLHPDSQRTKPARLLFMKGLQRYPHVSEYGDPDEEVDIDTCDEPIISPFDSKTKVLVAESEKIVMTSLGRDSENGEDSCEPDMSTFTPRQKKLYEQVLNVLSADHLAKLSFCGTSNESLKKRLMSDKTTRLIRQKFGLIFWDMELLSWLHKTLLTYADGSILVSYIDVLQTLKSKVPVLIDRVLQSCAGSSAGDSIMQAVKKPYDPVSPVLNQIKPKKLHGNPILLICPSSSNQAVNAQSQRFRFWHSNLSSMCKVINVSDEGRIPSTIEDCLEQIMQCVRNKITELKNHYPNRPLILLGWSVGALIACHIALQELIDAVICLGFPLTGVNGSRGDLNDPLLDLRVPTLFIVGQNARTCSTDDIEDFRSRMKAETGLVIVGGADDMLRMCPTKMKLCCVTQPMVDRCLLDEVGEFLQSAFTKTVSISTPVASALVAKSCTPIREEEDPQLSQDDEWKPEDEGKRKRRKPKEYSPELSPVRKRQRHHLSRQASSSPKVRLRRSSTESSSSGLENYKTGKSGKKMPGRRVGRPPGTTFHKRLKIKPIKDPRKEAKILRKAARMADESYSPARSSKCEPLVPFSKAILPKKNEMVDVEKAFGCDSGFLARPLSPPEPEDTVSAEETERAMAELEAQEAAAASGQKPIITFTDSLAGNTISLLGETVRKEGMFMSPPHNQEDIGYVPTPFSTALTATDSAVLFSHVVSPAPLSPVAAETPDILLQGESPESGPEDNVLQSPLHPAVPKTANVQETLPVSTLQKTLERSPQIVSLGISHHAAIPAGSSQTTSPPHSPKIFSPVKISQSGSTAASENPYNTSHHVVSLGSVHQIVKVSKPQVCSGASTYQAVSPTGARKNVTIAPNLQSFMSKGPTLPSPIHSIKNTKNVSLLTSNGSNPVTKSILTVPSGGTSILAGSSVLKSQPNKVIQLLTKGAPLATPPRSHASTSAVGETSVDRQQFNLSLLSDVAGMTEPMIDTLRKPQASSTATLVKLAAPPSQEVRSQPVKVYKTIYPCVTAPQRADTTEEMIEKQLAIQALNRSINMDSPDTSNKERGYSVCYTKSDGSIISHSVKRPPIPTYLTRAPNPTPPRGRGRGRPPLTPKPFTFM